MKKLMLIASVLFLASCGNNTTEEVKVADSTAATIVAPVEVKNDSACADSCAKACAEEAKVTAPTTAVPVK